MRQTAISFEQFVQLLHIFVRV